MKALILAAGEGTRLKKYTEHLPKGMLVYRQKTLIKHQIDAFRSVGIHDIVIVRGYKKERIRYPDIHYYDNPHWSTTNMVVSLLQARDEFNDDLIVSYSDLFFNPDILERLQQFDNDVGVVVDKHWQHYWQKRYGRVDFDTESLVLDKNNNIISLGKTNPKPAQIHGRYVGLLKFSKQAITEVLSLYDTAKLNYWNIPWQHSPTGLRQAYMTDLLQEIIDTGNKVKALVINGGWLEFDTNEDYEKQQAWVDIP